MESTFMYEWELYETYTKFVSENLEERDHLWNVSLDRRKVSNWILKKYDVIVRVEFMLLRMRSSGGLLYI